ncbi:hypothetical protein HHK36_015988 [Tetracentron sinense]|uniref:RING-type E3 ubiquitin transferase n=1 Tax=Tetracentron sinense TaxID=13715 RepID=A0A835DBI9_TETSI|nr:hypothetical protein HHK36_015988 [Tetracentron sinense]
MQNHNVFLRSDLSPELAEMNSDSVVEHSDQLEAHCALCRINFSLDNEANEGSETISICRDCKVLFLEDLETTIQDSRLRRSHSGRRSRYSRSSESIEDLFSQQFSHLINLVRQNQHSVPVSVSEHEAQLVDGDAALRVLQRTSSRTTPSGSRRWRRVLSDNESEGFDNLDSIFGENESNVSFGGYRAFHGESDAISFSAYGGDSDVSVDGHSLLDREILIQPDDGSDVDSDTDIDPMHAGLSQGNSDDQDEDDDGEWEEAEVEENTVETTETEGWIWDAFTRSPGENNGPINWLSQSPEFGGMIRWRIRESRRTYIPNIFTNLEESEVPPYIGNTGDYLDARGFEELLEHLAETDSSRRGAPPVAASFVNSLPRVVIDEEHEKHGGLVCAVCKDPLPIGTEVNQLPCFHLYHSFCILPWLRARNSCPLCRYELPTDNKDFEGKQSTISGMEIHEIRQQDLSEDSSSDITDDAEADEGRVVSEGLTEQGRLVNVDSAMDSSGRDGTLSVKEEEVQDGIVNSVNRVSTKFRDLQGAPPDTTEDITGTGDGGLYSKLLCDKIRSSGGQGDCGWFDGVRIQKKSGFVELELIF